MLNLELWKPCLLETSVFRLWLSDCLFSACVTCMCQVQFCLEFVSFLWKKGARILQTTKLPSKPDNMLFCTRLSAFLSSASQSSVVDVPFIH